MAELSAISLQAYAYFIHPFSNSMLQEVNTHSFLSSQSHGEDLPLLSVRLSDVRSPTTVGNRTRLKHKICSLYPLHMLVLVRSNFVCQGAFELRIYNACRVGR